MSWHQFRYIFSPEVENAMRYSIEEAIRRVAQTAPLGGSSKEIMLIRLTPKTENTH